MQEINFRNSPVVGLVAAAVAIAAPIIAWYCTAPLRIGDEVAAKIAAKRRDSPPAPLRARARPEMAALSPGLPRRQRSPVANAGSALRRDAPVRTPPEPSKPSTPPRVVLAAAARGDVAALSSIIAADPAAVGAVNKDGWTPLHFAAYKDQSAAVSLLLNLSADVNANEKDWFTPLMLAAQEGHAAVVGILLQHGADVGHREKTGWTALHFAAQEGHLEVVQSLLRSGADVNTRDENGLTALAVAERERRDSIAAVLRRAGGIK